MKLSPVRNLASQRGGFSSLSLCLATAGIILTAVICFALVGSRTGDEAGPTPNGGTQIAKVSPQKWFASGRWRADARTLMCAIKYLLEDEDAYPDPLWKTKASSVYVLTNPPTIRPRA
jgi:hypothetical protein